MKETYNNILDFLSITQDVPTWCFIVAEVSLLVLLVILMDKLFKIRNLDVQISDLELEVQNFSRKVEAKESLIDTQRNQIKKKENLLVKAQEELAEIRDRDNKPINLHNATMAKIGKSSPSTRMEVSKEVKSLKPTANRSK